MCEFKKKRSQNLSQKKMFFFFPAGVEGRQQKNQGSRGNRRFRSMKVIGREARSVRHAWSMKGMMHNSKLSGEKSKRIKL